ncbi:hypothetical protein [Alicyclobacillus acidoterrestris]|uniref:Uncharacterized protein n=1 Tax=Alicyclobacillus acidoterrestris (strain ATCC 49025 / DSM 3922 / CIP 106132 / NCIMB 13137 / GD3B) TaxID=1356854 RepID=A0A9E6ZHP4_ALIAG|nr:hypothetical protein [Alicyclobacillus acidoterrestris]UNO47251.1 hypothetical protein K1I37_10915 [Alicyclobacillus acidoterrestris]
MLETADCIRLYGDTLSQANATAELRNKLDVAVPEARTKQSLCLFQLHNIEGITELRDLGGVLTDLSRIMDEVTNKSVAMTGSEIDLSTS